MIVGPAEEQLIETLADGRIHSGEQLARRLSISPHEVSDGVRQLWGLGLDVQVLKDQGFQLLEPIELLDAGKIGAHLDPAVAARVARLDVYLETDSTNERMLIIPGPDPGLAHVCLAEFQTSGRGRMGRRWHAPFASGICLSIAWQFADPRRQSPALALAIGVAMVDALETSGIPGARLKWPNDVIWDGRKLAGVLIQSAGETQNPGKVVVGAGLNYRLGIEAREAIAVGGALKPADLKEMCGGDCPGRNRLAASLIQHILSVISEFEDRGLASFGQRWRDKDYFNGKPVTVQTGADEFHGIARGIDDTGALLVDADGKQLRLISGDVSLRSQ